MDSMQRPQSASSEVGTAHYGTKEESKRQLKEIEKNAQLEKRDVGLIKLGFSGCQCCVDNQTRRKSG